MKARNANRRKGWPKIRASDRRKPPTEHISYPIYIYFLFKTIHIFWSFFPSGSRGLETWLAIPQFVPCLLPAFIPVIHIRQSISANKPREERGWERERGNATKSTINEEEEEEKKYKSFSSTHCMHAQCLLYSTYLPSRNIEARMEHNKPPSTQVCSTEVAELSTVCSTVARWLGHTYLLSCGRTRLGEGEGDTIQHIPPTTCAFSYGKRSERIATGDIKWWGYRQHTPQRMSILIVLSWPLPNTWICPRTTGALHSHTPGFSTLSTNISLGRTPKVTQRDEWMHLTSHQAWTHRSFECFWAICIFFFILSLSSTATKLSSGLFLIRKRSSSIHPLLGIRPSVLPPSGVQHTA